MATLATVSDYISAARILLQDEVQTYRYSDASLLLGLNLAILEARRLRSDLFMSLTSLPSYSAVDSTAVSIDEQYRFAFVQFIAGFAQMRDEETTEDVRAAAFFKEFTRVLTGAV